MRKFGLIGFPLGHSFSVPFFKLKFEKEKIRDISYLAYPIPSLELFPNLIESNPELIGLNVTIPYKEKIIPFLDSVDPEAKKIGAVNTILLKNNQKLGFNTDIIGFKNSLIPLLDHKMINGALVLGTGGASNAVGYVLNEMKIPFLVASRKETGHRQKTILYSQVDKNIIKSNLLIINCTPLGMYPNIDQFPEIPYEHLNSNHILYDLVYNPEETQFLNKGKLVGATLKNGLEMLYLQAEASWKIWNQ